MEQQSATKSSYDKHITIFDFLICQNNDHQQSNTDISKMDDVSVHFNSILKIYSLRGLLRTQQRMKKGKIHLSKLTLESQELFSLNTCLRPMHYHKVEL